MYVLIGIKKGHYPGTPDEESNLALFTTRKLAEKYAKWAKLASYDNYGCMGRCNKQFRQKSILNGYCSCYIEDYEKEELQIDPPIPT